jgi:hypothetical protein
VLEIFQHTLKYFGLKTRLYRFRICCVEGVQLFFGKAEDWDTWSFGFKARAVIYKYEGILSGDEAVPTHADYKSIIDAKEEAKMTDEEKKQVKMYRLNSLAFSHLVSSMNQDKVSISILRNCTSSDYPNGNSYEGLKALQSHYNI